MKKKYYYLAVLFLIIFVLALAIWKKQHEVLGVSVISPLTADDPMFVLISQLEKSAILLDSPPVVTMDTITASISGIRVLFSKDNNLETQVRSLQLVLPRLRIDHRNISEVDLRFNKIIIR